MDGKILYLAVPIYIIIESFILLRHKKKVVWLRELLKLVFLVYLIKLLGITLFPIQSEGMMTSIGLAGIQFNLLPFLKAIENIRIGGLEAIYYYMKHFLVLMPFGLLYPILFHRTSSKWYILRVGVYLTFAIKFMQVIESAYGFTYWRIIDIDEVVLSAVGFIVAYMLADKLLNFEIFYRSVMNPPRAAVLHVEKLDINIR